MCAATLKNPMKFDFGETFDDFSSGTEKEPAWSAAEVEIERAQAMQLGLEQGRAQALAGIEQKIAESSTAIVKHLTRIDRQVEAATARIADEARALALVVGRKLGSELLAQARERDIEALVSEALSLLSDQPHVAIRVNDDLLDGLRTRVEAIARESGYQGKLILLGEPDLDRADCQIEWADGGMMRDVAHLDADIDRIVRRHLAADSSASAALQHEPEEERP
jgi:flagellar assembly protein FliH